MLPWDAFSRGGLWSACAAAAAHVQAESWHLDIRVLSSAFSVYPDDVLPRDAWAHVKPEPQMTFAGGIFSGSVPMVVRDDVELWFRLRLRDGLESPFSEVSDYVSFFAKVWNSSRTLPLFPGYLADFPGSVGINSALLDADRPVFLNAPPGDAISGFFTRWHLRHRNCWPVRSDSVWQEFEHGVFVPEVARLDESLQADLSRSSGKIICGSAYAVDTLVEHGILKRETGDWLLEHKVPLPAVPAHSAEAELNRRLSAKKPGVDIDWAELGEGGLRDTIAEIEISAILSAHSIVGDSQNKIAEYLGISRGSLQNKLKKYRIRYRGGS